MTERWAGKEGGGRKVGVAGPKDGQKRGVVASKALDDGAEMVGAGQRCWPS